MYIVAIEFHFHIHSGKSKSTRLFSHRQISPVSVTTARPLNHEKQQQQKNFNETIQLDDRPQFPSRQFLPCHRREIQKPGQGILRYLEPTRGAGRKWPSVEIVYEQVHVTQVIQSEPALVISSFLQANTPDHRLLGNSKRSDHSRWGLPVSTVYNDPPLWWSNPLLTLAIPYFNDNGDIDTRK